MDDATIFCIVLLGSSVALTALGTLIWKRPGTAARCVTGVTAIVTDNLMDKYADWRSDRQG